MEKVNWDNGGNPERMERGTEISINNGTVDTGAPKNEALEKIIHLIGRSNQQVKNLYKIATLNQNTRKDIKEIAYVLRDLVSQLAASDLTEEVQTRQREITEARNKGTETKEASTRTE